jgi:hypothetical protein
VQGLVDHETAHDQFDDQHVVDVRPNHACLDTACAVGLRLPWAHDTRTGHLDHAVPRPDP